MKEKDFAKSFLKNLKQHCPSFWCVKIHGHERQLKGVPDNLLCCYGKFIAIEFKIDRGNGARATPLQSFEMERIFKAGGVAVVVWRREKDGRVGFVNREYDDINTAAERFYWDLVAKI